jgi:hypothetical protein
METRNSFVCDASAVFSIASPRESGRMPGDRFDRCLMDVPVTPDTGVVSGTSEADLNDRIQEYLRLARRLASTSQETSAVAEFAHYDVAFTAACSGCEHGAWS